MTIVSFVNMKGGVGKTTLAVNVADALNRRHDLSILLVDLDPQFNATQCIYSGEEYVDRVSNGADTIIDIFRDTASEIVDPVEGVKKKNNKDFKSVKPWTFRNGFDIIPGNLGIYRIDMGNGQGRELRLRRYLQNIPKDTYDYVIVDTPPTPSHYMNSALLASEYYIVPVKPEPLSRVGIDLLSGVIKTVSENHAHDIECAGVVLTIADRRTKVYQDAVAYLDGNPAWKGLRYGGVLPQRTGVARGQGSQQLILDTSEEAAKTALTTITKEFLERTE
ncbi:ParA family protein [uncultured Sphingopyxis sp.]|jgi:chromosome partitioning protein|uniref:ParA family protein n=1 Tax=uncultured Sphingopyxis sp. TaxID=310581 RepID=UPI000A7ABEA3|nr:ParA family protein [uncultured Sphingopyxis sp.]